MTDYGRPPKDFGLRYEVKEYDSEVNPGWKVFTVVSVGRAESPATYTVTDGGIVFKREFPVFDSDEMLEAVMSCRKRVMALATKRLEMRKRDVR